MGGELDGGEGVSEAVPAARQQLPSCRLTAEGMLVRMPCEYAQLCISRVDLGKPLLG